MRVLHLVKSTNLNSGGPPKVVFGLINALRKKNIYVDLLSVKDIGGALNTEFPHHEFNYSRPFFLGRSNDLNFFLKNNISNYDLIHLHGVWDLCLHDAMKIAKKNGVPWVISPHGMFVNSSLHKSFIKKFLALYFFSYKNNFNGSSAIFYSSLEEVKNSSHLNLSPNKKILPNGFNEIKNKLSSLEAKELLQKIFPETRSWERIVIYYGRIHPEKGIEILIDAFNKLSCSHPNVGLIISGISHDHIYENFLIKKLHKLNLKNIIFNTTLRGDASFFLLQASDIFTLLSNQEGMSTSTIEAISESKPILISKNCNFSDIVKLGIGIETDLDIDSVIQSLNKLLSMSDSDLKNIGSNAYRVANNLFTWDAIVDNLTIDYQNILKK